MSIALLIDFGSTYTKVAAVDLDTDRFLGRTQAPSTVDTDITQGLFRALSLLKEQTGLRDEQVTLKLACSSAAGGLRMVAIGLIGRLTAEAAHRAALGAGAKVIEVFERALNSRTVGELETAMPDIILLAGGVDGGNHEVIVHNARRIAQSRVRAPVVVAGNVDAQEEVCAILAGAGQPAYRCANVMPALNVLDVEPARQAVREVFIRHIVRAKGLDRAREYVGDVVMPTPMAVLNMTELLAKGAGQEAGLGDTVVVDIGGATTDVHSACWGTPVAMKIPMVGLQESFAKRTVEGDLGLRVSAKSLLEVAQRNSLPRDIVAALNTNQAWLRAEYLVSHTDTLPHAQAEMELDVAMARAAAYISMERHAGVVETVQTSSGYQTVQRGKDLTEVNVIIGTGGVFGFGAHPSTVLAACLSDAVNPYSLRPKHPQLFVDGDYILYAGGLLSTVYPEKAIRLVKSSLRPVETPANSTPSKGE
ncbi:MAG: methylaspartate mutase accessory protein GlmL [Dehalococcoidia bacterium]|nr:methylaspartate mutase accessory protein GlmL [Dehalococcoidia bacterium]